MKHRRLMKEYDMKYKDYDSVELFELNVWETYDDAVSDRILVERSISKAKSNNNTVIING